MALHQFKSIDSPYRDYDAILCDNFITCINLQLADNLQLGFFPPNLVKIGAKMTFDPHLTPLDHFWGLNGGHKEKYSKKY